MEPGVPAFVPRCVPLSFIRDFEVSTLNGSALQPALGGRAAEVLWVSWQRLFGSPHASRARRALPAGRSERCLGNVSGPREEETPQPGPRTILKLGTGSQAEGQHVCSGVQPGCSGVGSVRGCGR